MRLEKIRLCVDGRMSVFGGGAISGLDRLFPLQTAMFITHYMGHNMSDRAFEFYGEYNSCFMYLDFMHTTHVKYEPAII